MGPSVRNAKVTFLKFKLKIAMRSQHLSLLKIVYPWNLILKIKVTLSEQNAQKNIFQWIFPCLWNRTKFRVRTRQHAEKSITKLFWIDEHSRWYRLESLRLDNFWWSNFRPIFGNFTEKNISPIQHKLVKHFKSLDINWTIFGEQFLQKLSNGLQNLMRNSKIN